MVKNLKDVMRKYNTEAKCREYFIQERWQGKPVCVYCGHDKVYRIENGERFKCANPKCYKRFRVTVGTIMHASNIPLTTWLPAMYLISAHKKGISSVQLAKDLGVTQKTAWFMLHRIRKSLKESNSPLLEGTTEFDETYMARKYRSDYVGLPPEEVERIQTKGKHKKSGAVIAIAHRETGTVRVKAFNQKTAENIKQMAEQNIAKTATIYTDESTLYKYSLQDYKRETINHWREEWVRGDVHVNNVENFWSVMKRGIYGIYHQISYKHLQAYCDEYSYRYNSRKLTDGERFTMVFRTLERPLSYKELVHGQSKENNAKEA